MNNASNQGDLQHRPFILDGMNIFGARLAEANKKVASLAGYQATNCLEKAA